MVAMLKTGRLLVPDQGPAGGGGAGPEGVHRGSVASVSFLPTMPRNEIWALEAVTRAGVTTRDVVF